MKTYKRSRNKSRNKSRNNTRNKGRNKSYRAKKGCNSYTKHRKHGGLPKWLNRFRKPKNEPVKTYNTGSTPNETIVTYFKVLKSNDIFAVSNMIKLLKKMTDERTKHFNEIDNISDNKKQYSKISFKDLIDLTEDLKRNFKRYPGMFTTFKEITEIEKNQADTLLDKLNMLMNNEMNIEDKEFFNGPPMLNSE